MQTNMFLIYVDESYDKTHFVYSALFVSAFDWNPVFQSIVQWRRELFTKHGITPEYELHATKFVGGQGEPESNRDKDYRARVFLDAFDMIENIDGVHVINAITDNKKKRMELFDWMLNRINIFLEKNNAYGILVCDEGNENQLVSMTRKKQRQNHIPSQYGQGYVDKPITRIIEDPLFKTSDSSYFIQLADFIAFALLRNENPLENTKKEVKDAFNRLDKILAKHAFRRDPRQKGIIRI